MEVNSFFGKIDKFKYNFFEGVENNYLNFGLWIRAQVWC
jgi:hypothetical protein